jgi:hypothetical protein
MSTRSTTKTISTLLLTLIATQSHPLLLLQITVPTCSKPLLL